MSAGHTHSHPRPAWGERGPDRIRGWLERVLTRFGSRPSAATSPLRDLPLALRRGPMAAAYLAAAGDEDHEAAAATAVTAMERAMAAADWWPADIWAHHALWHFEQAGDVLSATRQARRIGDLRSAAGDPDSARRYYAEAIDEARDIGAEQEQGLAAVGLGRALLDRGEVTESRRLASAAVDLLRRAEAPEAQIEDARKLLGHERSVGEEAEESR
jgi:tetratricopeptide (TPR) repeat protein